MRASSFVTGDMFLTFMLHPAFDMEITVPMLWGENIDITVMELMSSKT